MTSDYGVFTGAVSIAGRVNIDVEDEQEGALLTGNFDLSEVAQKITEATRGEYCGPTSVSGSAECYDGLTLQLEGKNSDIKVVVNDVLLTDEHGEASLTAGKRFTAGKLHVEVLEGDASESNPTVISLKFTEPVTMKWVAEYVEDPRFSFGGARRPSIQFASDAYKMMAIRDAADPTVAESKRISREALGRAEQRLTAHEGRDRVASRQLVQAAICHAENRFFEHEARSVTKLDSVAPRPMQARLFTPASTERASRQLSQTAICHAENRFFEHEARSVTKLDSVTPRPMQARLFTSASTERASRQLSQTAICHAENRFFEHEARSVTKLDSVTPRPMQTRLFTPASTERAQVTCTKSLEGQQVLMHPFSRLSSYDASSTTTSYKDIAFNAQEHASRLTAATAHCKARDDIVGSSNSAVGGGLNFCATSPATAAYFYEDTSVTDTSTITSTNSRLWRRAQSTEVRGSQGRCVHERALSYCRHQQQQQQQPQTSDSGQSITLMQSLRMTACMLRSYAASTGTPDAQAFLPFIQLVEKISQGHTSKALDLTTARLLQALLAEAMQRVSQRQLIRQEKWDIRVRPCSHSQER